MPQIRPVHAVVLFGILGFCHSTVSAQGRTGTLRGRVSVADDPATHIPVAAFELPDSRGLFAIDPISTGNTDAQGQYRLSGLPAGRYKVLPNIRSGWEMTSQQMATAATAVVRAGRETVQDLVLPSPRGVTVSGRVNGDTFTGLDFVSLSSGFVGRRGDVAPDGTFAFHNVSPGTYILSPPTAEFVWGAGEIQVESQNVAGIELVPDEFHSIQGRVITENGGPIPRFVFSLEGAQGSSRSSYVWVFDSRFSGMAAIAGWADKPDDVIFTVNLPIGEYRIRLVDLPPGYRVKSFTYGPTNLFEEPLRLNGELHQFSIVLSAPPPLVTIRGRIILDEQLPSQVPLDRVVLQSRALLTPLEAPIFKDGSFEISKVPPGIYDVTDPLPGLRLSVGDKGMRGVEIRASRVVPRWGQPERAAAAAAPVSTARAVRSIRARFNVEGEMTSAPSLVLKPVTGGGDIWISHSLDGTLSQSVPEGDYRVSVYGLDGRSEIESITYGSVDLRKNVLRITSDSDDLLVITARPKPHNLYSIRGSISGADPADLAQMRVFLQGGPSVRPASDGRFEFLDIPPSPYEIFANFDGAPYPEAAARKRLMLTEGNIEGIVLRTPRARKVLNGRIVVNGGYPMPRVALSVRPDVNSGPPFLDPFTRWLLIRNDGRFTVELPEGNHRLRVEGYPNYRVKSIRYGSADLREDLLRVEDGKLQDLIITFDAAPPVEWRRVKGRVNGIGNIAETVKVVLESTGIKHQIETVPRRDGSFEFPKVPPDTYTIWFAPRVAMTAARTLTVANRDVENVILQIPAQRTVNLLITAASGPLPLDMNLVLTANSNEAYTILLSLGVLYRTASEPICISDVCTRRMGRSLGEPAVISASPGDGEFVLRLPEGEYRAELQRIPADYQLQSFTQGTVDLRAQPVRVGPVPTREIVVQLRFH